MKKLKQSRHFKAIVALLAGSALLVTAAAAGYVASGGYSTYKQSIKQIMERDEYSMDVSVSLKVPGEEFTSVYTEQYDRNGNVVNYCRTQSSDGSPSESWCLLNDDQSSEGSKYLSIDRYLRHEYDSRFGSKQEYQWNIYGRSYPDGALSSLRSEVSDNDQMRRLERLVESALDMFVGDLKNNFISTGSAGGMRSYRITLTDEQMPEIVRSAVDFIYGEYKNSSGRRTFYLCDDITPAHEELFDRISDMRENGDYDVIVVGKDGKTITGFATYEDWYTSDLYAEAQISDLNNIFRTMDGTPRISTAECDFTVDKNGDLTYNRLYGELEYCDLRGERKTVSLEIVINISDLPEGGIPAPVIPESDTVYDYSIGNAENNYAYTITKNGVTAYGSQALDSKADEYDWFNHLSPQERIKYIFDYAGMEYDPDDAELLVSGLKAALVSGELEGYAEACGVNVSELFSKLVSDMAAVYGEDASAALTAPVITEDND